MRSSYRTALGKAHMRTALASLATATAFAALASFSAPAQAAFQLSNVALQCSGNLLLQEGDAYSLRCSGDLSLQGLLGQGSFLADNSITLQSTGMLSLVDMLLQAPTITLTSDTGVSMNSATRLAGPDVRLSGGAIVVDGAADLRGGGITLADGAGGSLGMPSSGSLELNSPVPEVSTLAMMALGLSGLWGLLGRWRWGGMATRTQDTFRPTMAAWSALTRH